MWFLRENRYWSIIIYVEGRFFFLWCYVFYDYLYIFVGVIKVFSIGYVNDYVYIFNFLFNNELNLIWR